MMVLELRFEVTASLRAPATSLRWRCRSAVGWDGDLWSGEESCSLPAAFTPPSPATAPLQIRTRWDAAFAVAPASLEAARTTQPRTTYVARSTKSQSPSCPFNSRAPPAQTLM